MIKPDTQIKELNRIGQATASKLKKLGITTAKDLLWHLPRDHQDFSRLKKIAELKINETATTRGVVELIHTRRSRVKKMNITECLLTDNTGSIKIIWFNQPYLTKQLKSGEEIFVAGKISDDFYTLQFTNPLWEKIKKDTIHTARLIPVYPSTEGLTQKQLRWLVKQVLPLAKEMTDYLPNEILNKYNLLGLQEALTYIHWPPNQKLYYRAQNRLKFEELFLWQLIQAKNKMELRASPAPSIPFQQDKIKKFVSSLPFKLTIDQKKAAWEILQDLEKNYPMNRLLQGDVGSGKTVVAVIAALNTALSGGQTALLAPTEILAQQHWQTFKQILDDFDLSLALLTRSQHQVRSTKIKGTITKQKIIKALQNNELSIIIGTHSLLQKNVNFAKLQLIIIDEQHRFGVKQRAWLKKYSQQSLPHFLSMTATPIPRTLALTLYGDLNISIIKEKPPGRKQIITKLIAKDQRTATYEFIKKRINENEQAFVICPLIEESDKLGVKAAESEYKKLKQTVFPELKIGLLHGRLNSQQKKQVMDDFQSGKTNILVATSVIEVGVDIPQATIMMIEGAERFGLAQLHQFRGRVGRAQKQSYCFLFTDSSNSKITDRLQKITSTADGLKLAEYDLKTRGFGELYGLRQSGLPNFKIADLNDLELIQTATKAASEFLKKNPNLDQYPLLHQKIDKIYAVIHPE